MEIKQTPATEVCATERSAISRMKTAVKTEIKQNSYKHVFSEHPEMPGKSTKCTENFSSHIRFVVHVLDVFTVLENYTFDLDTFE